MSLSATLTGQPLVDEALERSARTRRRPPRPRPRSRTLSPSSVVLAWSPCAVSRRSTTTHSSSVSPATNRPAPSRIPCRAHERPDAPAVGRAQDPRAEQRRSPARRRSRRSAQLVGHRRSRPPTSSGSRSRSGARTSGRSGTPLRRDDALQRGVAREGLDPRAQLHRAPAAPSSVGSRTTAATSSGNADASADTAPTAPASRRTVDQRLRADEDVEPVDQVALERLPRGVRHLHPDEVVGLLPQMREHRRVERRSRRSPRTRRRRTAAARTPPPRPARCARCAAGSSLKYGGPITATASAPASAACAARATVSAVVCAPQCAATSSASADRLEPPLEAAPALVDGEQHRLAVRAEGEHAVETGVEQEVRVRPEHVLVEPRTVVAQRRDRGRDRPVESPHAALIVQALSHER